ncbi:unnamed protein product [Urochloa decumbens]|uniref:F-box protein AT5G49610-like beta-propeller domain-containing protein n=1 Tax=Urochloa decumbens TaxID=240449 RepID=A0ABC9GYL7_9POAL
MPPPDLIDDATAEILLRLLPDDPSSAPRSSASRGAASSPAAPSSAATASSTGRPPLLGFFRNRREADRCPEFVSTIGASPFCCTPEFDCESWWTLDCRHGRVLFHTIDLDAVGFVVWDPVTDDKHYLPEPEYEFIHRGAAVFCAADGCNHLDCHGGPFHVVVVTPDQDREEYATVASVYSSETRAWEEVSYLEIQCQVVGTPCLLAGDALYFMATLGLGLFKYDLAKRELSVMNAPEDYHYELLGTIMTADGGGLGLAGVDNFRLHLWSWQDDAKKWVHDRIIDLKSLLPVHALPSSPMLIGFMEGSDTIFMNTYAGAFAIKVISGQVRKVGERGRYYSVLPYRSFYTPDLAGQLPPL